MSYIELEHIKKTYFGQGFDVEALKDISLEINKGEMVAIMGASASGKSTLLNLLGLIDQPTEGKYMLQNKNVEQCKDTELAKLRNSVFGFVLQDFALIERYTVVRNVMLPLYYSDTPRAQWKSRAKEVLEELGVPCDRKIYPTELSGGQRQRVAIARALVNNADVILADEPTGALDSATADDVMNVFKKLNDKGKTIIIVTHDDRIGNMCHRIVRIKDGRIV